MMAPKQQQDDDKNRQGGEIGKKSVVHQVCFLAQASFCKEGPSEPADGIAFLVLIIEQMQAEATKNLSSWCKETCLALDSRGVSDNCRSCRDIAGNDRTRPDDRIVADGNSWKDHGASADPDVRADANRAPIFKICQSNCRVTRMVGSIDLDGRPNLGAVTDGDRSNVQKHTVEVEEDALAEMDVVSIVDEEGGTYDAAVADRTEELLQLDQVSDGMVWR
jgi:hypothetical protein